MGLWQRFTMLFKAKASRALDRAELQVLTEIAHEGMLASIFARPVGLLGGDDTPPPAQAIDQRGVEAFRTLVESSTMTPYR